MPEKDILLRVENLKMYFPAEKTLGGKELTDIIVFIQGGYNGTEHLVHKLIVVIGQENASGFRIAVHILTLDVLERIVHCISPFSRILALATRSGVRIPGVKVSELSWCFG